MIKLPITIRGPLGLWSFPLLNLLLAVIFGSTVTIRPSQSPVVENVEEWEVVRDSEGLPKSIIVHRKVRAQE